jgi:regulator of protease activity HflC (stomatin/prohibitin superfamily)
MLGFKFIKTDPTTYLIAFRNGKPVREGTGLSCFYYAPTTNLVAVPLSSREQPFILEKVTADFQTVTIQGQVSFRIRDPQKTAAMLNFGIRPDGKPESEDPQKLAPRVVAAVEVLVQRIVQEMQLTDAILGAARLAEGILEGLKRNAEVASLGVEILGAAVLKVKPTPETARALEARAREAMLGAADDAIYERRKSAVENERSIKQSELDTEIAVEQKKRAIREAQMDAEASVVARKHELRKAGMEADIALEDRRQAFVKINAANTRTLAEAEAHRVAAVLKSFETTDPRVIHALAAMGMQPGQLIAQAFGQIAERADRIGQLNVSPDLLQSLMNSPPLPVKPAKESTNAGR